VRCAASGGSPRFGHPETEAAHVHPARHGGPDRETNGVLLCRRCHWGFDFGWLSFRDDHQIVVANDDTTPGHEFFHQFRDRSLVTPATPDLGPAERFVEVHRKLFGFDSIDEGDRLTFGGLWKGETRLIDGRHVRVRDTPDDALAVNCRVTDVGPKRVRCAHVRTLETRSVTDAEPVERPSDDITTWSFEQLSTWIQEIKDDHSGVRQKWKWGRIFRRIRADSGLSRAELAEHVDVPGTSTLQIERAEGVYEAFPDGEFKEDGLSYSAIAELQGKHKIAQAI
jgi:putative restriction endonuclease